MGWLVGGIAAVVLALAIAWVLFVPGADWLAHHDVGSAKGPLLQTARDAARGRLLTLGAGLFAAGALVFTARNFTLSRRIRADRAGAGDRPLHQGHRAARLRQARRAHRRHLRPGARRPRLRQRPPDRDGGSHRIHPRALTRAVAATRSRRPGTGTIDTARRSSRRHRGRAPGCKARHPNH